MSRRPLVSCICVTKNRRILLRKAIEYFHRSRYLYSVAGGGAELVIVDGSERPNEALVRGADPWIRYIHTPSAQPRVGHFHNVACDASRGDIVIQWDDDDWHNPYRIVRQSATLEAAGEAFTFSSALWWYHVSEGRACRSKAWGAGEGASSTGALFAYHRSLWQAAPFHDVDQAEDQGWWFDHRARGTRFIDSEDPTLVVYMRHNVNGSALTQYHFTEEDTLDARVLMGSDVNFYDELAEILPLTPWNHPNAPGTRAHFISPLQNHYLRHFR